MLQHATHLDRVRQRVTHGFQQRGFTAHEATCETILVRDGFYCGRRFEADGLAAVWFIQENELKFYDRDGSVAEVIKPCLVAEIASADVA